MVKLNKPLDPTAIRMRGMLDENRTEDAITLALPHLLEGRASPEVQAVVASLLRPTKRKRGGQKKARPAHWYEIAVDWYSLKYAGLTDDEVNEQLGKKYGFSDTHIRNCRDTYDELRAEADKANE